MESRGIHDPTSGSNDRNNAKRQKTSHAAPAAAGVTTTDRRRPYHPTSFVTWNCNGFSSRAVYNKDLLRKLVKETQIPDLVCIQEARLKASGPGAQRGTPGRDPKKKDASEAVRAALREVFGDYRPFWSLADKKYAGTLTLVRKDCLAAACGSIGNAEGSYDPDLVAFCPEAAIDLILRRLGTTREACGLSKKDPSREPKTAPVKTSPRKQQTSLKSFFVPVKKKDSASACDPNSGHTRTIHCQHQHHPEGRFQFFFFPGMDVVQTYVPNNGTKEESFRRRKEWDETMRTFVEERNRILETVSRKHNKPSHGGSTGGNSRDGIDSSRERKFLWCGDMNVAATYRDGSHWERKGSNDGGSTGAGIETDVDDENNTHEEVYEWFRDESKCLGSFGAKASASTTKRPEDVGIPGFTPAERQRFARFLAAGDFCDVWRTLHPNGVVREEQHPGSCWEGPNYTWRGTVAKNFDGFARYQGKGQRIDYFLLAPSSRLVGGVESGVVEACDIRGYGTHREGLFCGSDHCAVELRLKGGSSSS